MAEPLHPSRHYEPPANCGPISAPFGSNETRSGHKASPKRDVAGYGENVRRSPHLHACLWAETPPRKPTPFPKQAEMIYDSSQEQQPFSLARRPQTSDGIIATDRPAFRPVAECSGHTEGDSVLSIAAANVKPGGLDGNLSRVRHFPRCSSSNTSSVTIPYPDQNSTMELSRSLVSTMPSLPAARKVFFSPVVKIGTQVNERNKRRHSGIRSETSRSGPRPSTAPTDSSVKPFGHLPTVSRNGSKRIKRLFSPTEWKPFGYGFPSSDERSARPTAFPDGFVEAPLHPNGPYGGDAPATDAIYLSPAQALDFPAPPQVFFPGSLIIKHERMLDQGENRGRDQNACSEDDLHSSVHDDKPTARNAPVVPFEEKQDLFLDKRHISRVPCLDDDGQFLIWSGQTQADEDAHGADSNDDGGATRESNASLQKQDQVRDARHSILTYPEHRISRFSLEGSDSPPMQTASPVDGGHIYPQRLSAKTSAFRRLVHTVQRRLLWRQDSMVTPVKASGVWNEHIVAGQSVDSAATPARAPKSDHLKSNTDPIVAKDGAVKPTLSLVTVRIVSSRSSAVVGGSSSRESTPCGCSDADSYRSSGAHISTQAVSSILLQPSYSPPPDSADGRVAFRRMSSSPRPTPWEWRPDGPKVATDTAASICESEATPSSKGESNSTEDAAIAVA